MGVVLLGIKAKREVAETLGDGNERSRVTASFT
jgi:hypothetical protein